MTKYRNKKTEINGITFDSKREAGRYLELMLMESAGLIRGLELQPEFPLLVKTGKSVGKYRADFRYFDVARKAFVVEDSKGVRTAVYRLKKRIVEEVHKIKIEEV